MKGILTRRGGGGRLWPRVLGLATAALLACPARGGAADLDGIEAVIKLLQEKKVITAEEAARFVSRLQQESRHRPPSRPQPGNQPVNIVIPGGERYLQTVTDGVARDIKEEVKREVKVALKDEIAQEVKLEAFTGSVPGWTKRIRFGGDIRLRYHGEFFDDNNATLQDIENYPELRNTTVDRHRLRYRIRIVAKAKINNQTEAGVRLATGNEKNPVSTNDTLGDYMNKDTVTFDLGYVKWTPVPETSTWTGDLQFWGGRFPNPFLSSELVWDKDVNFEGAAVTLVLPFSPRWKGLVNAGLFPLEEVAISSHDKWLYGGQLGIQYAPRTTLDLRLAVGWYDYQNIEGERNDLSGSKDYTVPRSYQEGNTIFDINEFVSGASPKWALASDFNELTVTGRLDLGIFDPVHVILLADLVKNLGFDQQEIYSRTGQVVPEEDTGYLVGLTVGYPKVRNLWDWQAFFSYRYLEADAALDAFTDSDFHFGGTNAKGWVLGGQLGIGKNLWLSGRWITADEVTGPPEAVDALQVDVNSRF